MLRLLPNLRVKIATTQNELKAAQRLRYQVFVEELGGTGEMIDHSARMEVDHFDQFYDHLILIDTDRDTDNFDNVVGVYRLLTSARVGDVGAYYSEGEYDLSVLKTSGRRLLELGRSCIHADYRNGIGMYHLWQGLSNYVVENNIEILFGVASFHGTNISKLSQPLTLLHQKFLAPKDLRAKAHPECFQAMDLISPSDLNRAEAMVLIPSLIKSYLRLGGYVGNGAFVDHSFNTTDICMILDVERMPKSQWNNAAKGQRI